MKECLKLNVTKQSLAIMKNESKTDNFGSDSRFETVVIINCVLNVPLMLITISGNALVLATLWRSPLLRSPANVFLCNLAVSDLLVGLVVQPILIPRSLHPTIKVVNSVYEILAISVGGATLGTMTAISVDRFLALHFHMKYPDLVTARRTVAACFSIWLACFGFTGLYLWSQQIAFFIAFVVTALCVCLSTLSYFLIYRIVRRHQLQIQSQAQAVQHSNNEEGLHVLQSKKKAINTFIYYICMIVCYSPVFVSMVYKAYLPNQWTIAWTFTDTVTYINSSINPLLYCWRSHELRSAVSKTLRKLPFRQDASEEVV